MNLYNKALIFALKAHDLENQRRKYTNEPYIVHPIAVADIVMSAPHTEKMLAAALLHDTVEDTRVTIEEIKNEFGDDVAEMVGWLTDVSSLKDGNRAARKKKDREHIALAPPEVKTIKLADLIDNTSTIEYCDPEFWIIYRQEKILLLKEALRDGDKALWAKAWELVGG